MKYIAGVPKTVPKGKVLVHKRALRPTSRLGSRGFRAWLADPDERYEVCMCGWAPHLVHHRVRRDAVARKPAE
jgi:hypothetical protein